MNKKIEVTIKKVSSNEPNVSKRHTSYDVYHNGKYHTTFNDINDAMDHKEKMHKEDMDLDETVLSIQQRQKRAQIMRRNKSKIERAREIAKKKMAPEANIRKRAFVQARQMIRRRVAGERGAEYEKLGPSEKMIIDRAVEGKQKIIKKLALRLIPRVKQAESKRLQTFLKGQQLQNHGQPEGNSKESSGSSSVKESLNILFKEAFPPSDTSSAVGQRADSPVISSDKKMPPKGKSKNSVIIQHSKFQEELEYDTQAFASLFKKSEKSGIDLEILGEVYDRGWNNWSENYGVSQQQYAFARVNSYINQGKTYFNEDADLHEISDAVKGRYVDKARQQRFDAYGDNLNYKHAISQFPQQMDSDRHRDFNVLQKSIKKNQNIMRKRSAGLNRAERMKESVSEDADLHEGVDSNHPIVKEYKSLNKHDIKTLRNMIGKQHKVIDTSEFRSKDHAISHLLRHKHGNKKVDQAFGFNEDANNIDKISDARLKYYATKNFPHGEYTSRQIKDEHERRRRAVPNYHTVKPSLSKDIRNEAFSNWTFEMKPGDKTKVIYGDHKGMRGVVVKKHDRGASYTIKHPDGTTMQHHTSTLSEPIKEEVQQSNENFIDGKGPGKPGDAARHGLKGKSASELRKIRSSETASPRQKQLAHWMLNMHHNEETELDEGGLWDNIHAKRKRIKAGSGERMRRPGSKGAPTKQNFKDAQESVDENYDVNSKHYKALTDLDLNTKNRDMTAQNDGYGPLNPMDKKGSKAFWDEKAKLWNTTTEAAMEARCRNCAAFNQSPAVMKKMAEGLGPAGKKIQDLADLGFCELFEFKCAGARTCNKWLVNGPITEQDTNNGTALVDKESNNSKARKKIDVVDRKSPFQGLTRQAEIKHKIIDENKTCSICDGKGCKCKAGNVESSPNKREIGTDSLVKTYKADTPFSESIDESFNIAFAAGVGITLTAADLGMKAQSGFAYHPSVQKQMDEMEEEVRTADVRGVIVKTASGKTVVRRQKVDRKIIGTGNLTDGKPDDTL